MSFSAADKKFETLSLNFGFAPSSYMEASEPIYMNSGFVYHTAEEAEAAFKGDIDRHVYSRFHNPTTDLLEKRLAILEDGEACRVTGSGMSAIFTTLLGLLKAGDHIVAAASMFSSSFYIITEILPKYGITYELIDNADLTFWEKALSRSTQMVLLESPTNPICEILDIKAIAKLAHKQDCLVVMDNAFATPYLQKPLQLGADIVIHSATKYIDGHGRCLGGAIIGKHELFDGDFGAFIRHTGPHLSPFNAWCMLQGLETLSLRMERHCHNAMQIAQFLENHEKVKNIYYPGLKKHKNHEIAARQMRDFGGMLAFEVEGGKKAAFQVMNNLKTIHICNNLGDSKSLICNPYTSTHASVAEEEKQKQGITEGLMRLSVGLEHRDDLLSDLKQSLDVI